MILMRCDVCGAVHVAVAQRGIPDPTGTGATAPVMSLVRAPAEMLTVPGDTPGTAYDLCERGSCRDIIAARRATIKEEAGQ